MRNFKWLAVSCLLVLFVSTSCSVTFHGVTEAPMGERKGEAQGTDYSFRTAAKKGDVERIGAYKVIYGAFRQPKTIVYGTEN